ncbi:8724_t:CDS:2, partial [Racocetra persica]
KYLPYWHEFFQNEVELDEMKTLKIICSFLSNPYQFEKPIIPYVEDRLQQLTNYIESNIKAIYFGLQIDELITSNRFKSFEFNSIFQNAFTKAYLKFATHIPSHSRRPLFKACQIFNPKFIHTGGIDQKNL